LQTDPKLKDYIRHGHSKKVARLKSWKKLLSLWKLYDDLMFQFRNFYFLACSHRTLW